MSGNSGNNDCKVYVGNLPQDIRERDLEDVFYKYGKIIDVDLHNAYGRSGGIPFAFIEFDDPRLGAISYCYCVTFTLNRDADDAVRGRDGYTFDGYKLRVEFPRSSNKGRGDRGGDRDGGGYRGGGGRGFRGGGGFGGGRGGGFSRGSKPRGYPLEVTGLPLTGSWQDVKDHFREAGDVIFADVFKDTTGIVEFSRQDHMKRALRDLDDSKFRSHEVEHVVCALIRITATYLISGRDELHPSERAFFWTLSFPQAP